MKIALFISHWPIHIVSWFSEIVNGFAVRGFEVDLYIDKAGQQVPAFEGHVKIINLSYLGSEHLRQQDCCVELPNIPFSYLLPPLSILIVRNTSSKRKYDYCIGFESAGLLLAKIAADASGCPFAYMSFELYCKEHPGVWKDRIGDFKKFESMLLSGMDLFMIQDKTREREYFKILNTNQRPQSTMYFPVSLPSAPLEKKPRYWHKKFNLLESLKIVFYEGQICSNRFVDKMVISAQSFCEDQLLVAHGPAFAYVNDTLRQLKELDRKNKAIFSTNEVQWDQMKYLSASADVGLVFYRDDNINDFTTGKSSSKMASYMRAGIPVVCSKYPTFEEVVNEYHNGECISDFAELPLSVNRILGNYSYYCEGARNAFEDIYDADKHLDVLADHIRNQVCNRSTRGIVGVSKNNETGQKEIIDDFSHYQNASAKLAVGQFKTGFQCLRQGDAVAAVRYLDEAAENCPALPNLHFARATALAQIGKLGLAKEACQAELMWRPENSNARGFLGRIEETLGEFAENRKIQGQENPVVTQRESAEKKEISIEELRNNIFEYTKRVSIELSNLCNYAGVHKKCPLSWENQRVILSKKVVENVLDCLSKYSFEGRIAFHTYNEPLIDPRLFLFIAYAKARCLQSHIMIMTNGYYFNQTLAEELVEIGAGSIYVTAYGQEDRERLSKIKVGVPYFIQKQDLDDRLNLYDRKLPEKENRKPCYAPLREIIITRDGRVSLCCLDWKRKHCFGDLYHESLEDVILEGSMLDVYNSLSNGNRIFEICKKCGWSR
jgi:glycosyltransferase involved in cell wall biosynthesis